MISGGSSPNAATASPPSSGRRDPSWLRMVLLITAYLAIVLGSGAFYLAVTRSDNTAREAAAEARQATAEARAATRAVTLGHDELCSLLHAVITDPQATAEHAAAIRAYLRYCR